MLYRFVGTDVTTLKSTRLLRHRGVNRQSIIYQFNKDDQQIRQVSKNVDNKDLKWQIKQKYSTESLKKKNFHARCQLPITKQLKNKMLK